MEESECDRCDEQEEGLDWGKVGGLMSKDVDQLQQSREHWLAKALCYQTDQHPWNAGEDPCQGSQPPDSTQPPDL